jgi:hypothetical protein
MTTEPKIFIAWDKELATKAAKQHKYIYVTKNQKQRQFKLLTGADNAWNPRANKQVVPYIYISELRIMGLKEDVVEVLSLTLSDAEIKNHLKTAYTKTNHGADYEAEVDKLKLYRAAETVAQKNKIKYGLDDLAWFVEALKDVREEPMDKLHNASKVSPKSRRDLFRDLYQKAIDGNRYINVSTLDGAGAKLKDQPAKKGNFVHSELTKIETDNLKNYTKAIEWVFGSTDQHEEDIAAIKSALAGKKGKKVVKKTTPKKIEPVAETPVGSTPVEEVKSKKKQMGSPRKNGIPGSKSPGAVVTRGGDNFTPIPSTRTK